jgi:hypothetical protein
MPGLLLFQEAFEIVTETKAGKFILVVPGRQYAPARGFVHKGASLSYLNKGIRDLQPAFDAWKGATVAYLVDLRPVETSHRSVAVAFSGPENSSHR